MSFSSSLFAAPALWRDNLPRTRQARTCPTAIPPPRLPRPLTRAAGGLALMFCLLDSQLWAQGETGKLEGSVHDVTGVAIAQAQIYVVGSAFSALTDPRGHFFINNVPAGTWSVRAAFLGYHPVQAAGLRILADQTVTQDFVLSPAPVELREITVVAADNLLVPRDEVATKQRIDGEYADQLPIDRVDALLALQPGVVASLDLEPGVNTLSIRGGRPDQAVTYIDGVPVTAGFRSYGLFTPSSQVSVGTNGLAEASVTTGASSAEFGNAQSGVIALVTRTGGQRYSGAFSVESDEPFGVNHGRGLNRLEANLSGPLLPRLTAYVGGVLEGRRSLEAGAGAETSPIFVEAGVDTVVRQPSARDDPDTEEVDEGLVADTTLVTISRYAVGRGRCEDFAQSASPGVRSNYGFACQGVRTPASASSVYELQAKLSYTYGAGSRMALGYLASRDQGRQFDYQNLYNSSGQYGDQRSSQLVMLTWAPNLRRSAERALALETYLSYQQDRTLHGPLTAPGELASRDPFGGFLIRPLEFLFDFDNWPITESLIDNWKSRKAGARVLPFDPANAGQYDPITLYRTNAYALPGWSQSGWPTLDRLSLLDETRYVAKANLDWQVDRYNRLKAGGDFTRYTLARYQSTLAARAFDDIFLERPVRWSLFAEDRLDLGDVVLVGGLRYDAYDSRAERPFILDTVPGSANFGRYVLGFDPSVSGTFQGPPLQGLPLTTLRRDRSHGYLSPHLQVAFPVTDRTNFRLSYAHQVQAPDFAVVLREVNVGGFGTDLEFGKSISFEFGIRHSFSDDMVLDLAAYNKDDVADPAVRTLQRSDPVTGLPSTRLQATNLDFGNTRGLDVRLDRRIGNIFNGTVAYSYQTSRNTASDPLTNLGRGVIALAELSGTIGPPPQATVPTTFSRPHTLSGAVSVTIPSRWRHGSAIGAVLSELGLFATFLYTSGTAYTRCETEAGNTGVFSDEGCTGLINRTRLPAFRRLDLRVTKGFALGRLGLTAYLDARNVLNFRNIVRVFALTGAISSDDDKARRWSTDSSQYAVEAAANSVLGEDGVIDLSFAGRVASGCGGWVDSETRPSVPNCVYLIRAEERFGDGDHRFDLDEQRRASMAFYDADRGIQNFTGEPRRLRLGLELTF